MNPSFNNPGIELPPPSQEGREPIPQSGESNRPENRPASQEMSRQVDAATAHAAPPISIPLPTQPQLKPVNPTQPPQTDDGTTSQTSSSLIQDKDLIDKEWVNKAKSIVEKTLDDPYKQSEELNTLKADYMKKHFNKTLKLNS